MKQNKVTQFLEKVNVKTRENSPAILAGVAVLGVLATVYSAWKAAPKAEEVLKKHREDMATVKKGDTKAKTAVYEETVKELVPIVLPTIISAGGTCAAIIGSQSMNARRIAALNAVATLSNGMVKDLNEQMIKSVGPKKAKEVKDAVFEKKVKEEHGDDIPVRDEKMRKKSLYWCRDYYTGNLIQTNAMIINQAITDVSSRIGSEMYMSLGEFWQALEKFGSSGMENLFRSPMKDEFGWSVDDLNQGRLDISYRSVLDDDDSPILALEYSVKSNYRR